MSTGPTLTAGDPSPRTPAGAGSFALRHAKRSFEPTNTNPTPRMFADKWRGEPA